jgi:hypothetical protein
MPWLLVQQLLEKSSLVPVYCSFNRLVRTGSHRLAHPWLQDLILNQ